MEWVFLSKANTFKGLELEGEFDVIIGASRYMEKIEQVYFPFQ